jgi:hypothetical protein
MDTTCKSTSHIVPWVNLTYLYNENPDFHKPRTTSERLRHLLRCPLCGICEGKLLGNIYTPTQAHPQSALPAPRATKTRWKGVNDVEEHRGLDDARFYPRWLSSFNFPYSALQITRRVSVLHYSYPHNTVHTSQLSN